MTTTANPMASAPMHPVVGRIAKEIKLRRDGLDLSQSELADHLGVTAAYVSHLETGRREPSVEILERLASALKCRVGDFFDETPMPVMLICPACGGQGCVPDFVVHEMNKNSADLMLYRTKSCPPNPSDDGRASARPVHQVVGPLSDTEQ